MADVDLVLLPWLRRGGTTALTAPDTNGPDQAGVTTARAAIAVNDAPPVTMDVRLMGPGHVTGLQPGQVIRTDPTPGSRAFEPNYCPLIEFDEPSLPWLFTPAAPSAAQRLRPWLCLVVVRQQPGVRIDPPRRGTLPVLTIGGPANPNAELPDLADSWAWAHAQLTGELPARGPTGETDEAIAAMTQQLAGRPDRTLSRLISGRVLAPETDYLACVVPTFELGRLAGLGLEVTGDEEQRLQPAWTLGDALKSVELPVYHSWEFATGPNGDFQSLAMLLRARPLPTGIGQRPIDVSASGIGVPVPDGTAVPVGGALRPIPVVTDPPTVPPSTWPDETLHDDVRAGLAGVLNTADTMPTGEALLAPPRYGATQAGLKQLDPTRRDRWYEELNLEPPARATAQFGTQLVQEQQEALVAAAWEQAAEVDRVNAVLRHAQFGSALGLSLHRRHIATMQPDVGLQAIAPARAHITRSAAANRPDTGLVALWQNTQVTPAAFGTAMRRMARVQGAIGRRVLTGTATEAPVEPRRSVLFSLQPDRLVARFDAMVAILVPIVGQPIDGLVTLERVALALSPQRLDITWAAASAAAVTNAPRRPFFEFTPLTSSGGPVPPIITVPVTPTEPVGPVRPTRPTRPTRPRPDRPGRPGGTFEPFARLRPIDPDNPGGPFDPDLDPVDPEPDPDPVPPPPRRDSAAAAAFRVAAAAHLQRFDPRPPPRPRPLPLPAAELGVVFSEALLRIDPTETFAARIRVLVARDGTVAAGAETPDERLLDAVGFTPRFPQPLAPALGALDQDLMLPGLDLVPPNTVVPLQTNSPFVDAVMVGFNSELGRELVWREFPAPLTATFADRFWDAGAVPRPPDMPPLADWADRPLGGALAGDERFVVLLRSELLRRYPDAVVYATKPGSDPAMPILSGAMEPDVRFFGFDIAADEISEWSIVIAEQPTAPRFGVEVDEVPAGAHHLAPTGADSDAARLARRLRQHPVRVTIPATVLLRQEPTPPPPTPSGDV